MSTIQIIALAFVYVIALFLIAYTSDKNKPSQISSRRKALVYSFSLAIYCTSWTFYGAVGSAANTGWGYLPIYLGPLLVYTIGWQLLRRFVRVGHEQNTTSISDFIAARFGKSQTIAAIVTIIAVIAIIPYVALQLKAITMSIEIFDAQQNLLSEPSTSAFYITLMLVVFSILFGTRNIDVTEHQYGMMNAIAFESVVKLIAFCAVGLFALFYIFDGPASLVNNLANSTELRTIWVSNIDWENFITQTLLAAVAIFCLPRQFHVSVVEYHQKQDLQYARWIFPIYLILISLFVIPIALAGNQLLSPQSISPDTFILALPLAENQNLLSALVFIGGLSAATGMVIVATVALSTMVSNDLVLPFFLSRAKTGRFKNNQFAAQMLLTRRIVIALSLFLSYAFYRLFDKSQSLASIGFLSFTAVLQFAPALFLGMFWSRANEYGAITGLISGLGCWFILTWVPSINGANLLESDLSYTGFSILTESVFIALAINTTAIVIISNITEQSLTEKIQAYAYTRARPAQPKPNRLTKQNPQLLVRDLKGLTAAIVGNERMISAFETYARESGEQLKNTSHASQGLLKQTEKILSASIGASSARVVLLSALKDKGINVDDVISLLSSTSQALKFNRHLIDVTLDNISQGISVSDPEKNIVAWNYSYERLMNYPKGLLKIGMPVAELIRFNAERGYCGPGEVEFHVKKRLAHLESGLSYRFERERNDGIVIETVGNPLPQGGYVTTYTDISEYKNIQKALEENERKTALYTDNSPALLAYLDDKLIYRFVNKSFAASLRRSKESILGNRAEDVLSQAELEFKMPFIQQALNDHKQQFEYETSSSDPHYYLITYIPNHNPQGEVNGIYTISQDISNRRKAELALKEINVTLEQRVEMRTDELHSTVKALEEAKKESEQANHSKSRFLAAASHDLLQPFNAARLFSSMLKNETGNMTESQAELVEKTDQSLTVAENIIHSLVDISKLDSGTIKPNIGSFDIYDVIESISQQHSSFAENKGLKFKTLNRHVNVISDTKLLYRILQNFVSNAIRYTESGGILISVQDKRNFVKVAVWDTGVGIQTDDQQVIFSEFKRIEDPRLTSTESGLGLGLSISERLATILDHPITVSSEYGRGSVFSLKLQKSVSLQLNSAHLNSEQLTSKQITSKQITSKLSESEVSEFDESTSKFTRNNQQAASVSLTDNQTNNKPENKKDILSGVKALCVDNEKQIIEAMTMLLGRWDCQVQSAQAESEIESLLANGFIPDIMLVDYQLDFGKTGLAFIQAIREKTWLDIPAIIITANHSPEVEHEILNAKIQILRKPVKPAILRATMSSVIRWR